jgi:hypothetical protein
MMADPLPSHATILVHYISPLELSHAEEHANSEVHTLRRRRSFQLTTLLIGIRTHGSSTSAGATTTDLRWQIKNKYYTANVGFRVLELHEEGEDEPAVVVLVPRGEVRLARLFTIPLKTDGYVSW